MARIVIEVPEELKQLAEAVKNLVAEVQRRVLRAQSDGRVVEYEKTELAFAEQAMAIERAAHQAALSALDIDEPEVVIERRRHKRVLRSKAQYRTMAGPVEVERSLYRDAQIRNGPTVDAVSLRAGAVGEGWLPGTADAMSHAVQMSTSREAEQQSQRQHRLPYSRSSFEDVAHLVGEHYVIRRDEVEDWLIERLPIPDEVSTVSASLDRTSIPVVEAGEDDELVRVYRMGYCGTITLHDRDGEAIHTIRYGRMNEGDVEGMMARMRADVLSILERKPWLKVANLADGAVEIWRRLDAAFHAEALGFRRVFRLLDFWHVLEKLAAAAQVLGRDLAEQTVQRWRFLLLNSDLGAESVLGELLDSECRDVRVGEKRPVHEAITYLENNLDLMRYAEARRFGLPVGSGNVEATCKSLIQMRMKRPGARWKQRTGEHIIELRALALSDRWEDGVRQTLKPLRKAVRRCAA